MTTEISLYLNKLTQQIKEKISEDITDEIINDDVEYHLNDKASLAFQKYYFETVSKIESFLSETIYFHKFKKQYAFQGIDNNYLNRLEEKKREIIQLIKKRQLTELYFDHFSKAKIRQKTKDGEKDAEKNLGSFFTKLVHTFWPDEFCPLDNPIKNYF